MPLSEANSLAAMRYARGLVARLGLPRSEYDDAAQEAMVAYVESAARYDPAKSGWMTYASIRMKGAIRDYARRCRVEVGLDRAGEVAAESRVEAMEARIVAEWILRRVSEADRGLLEAVYLKEETQRNVGARVGASDSAMSQRVRGAERRAGRVVEIKQKPS